MPSMIFLYTGRLSEDPKSGSAVRPVKMLEAFKEIGFEVAEITGYSADRARGYAKIRRKIREGKAYDFCYIETTTMPMALGDPGHLPLRPVMDIRFISRLKRLRIPVLLFYRDIHWVFPTYGTRTSVWKRAAALLFYKAEFKKLVSMCDAFFLPSTRMERYLPIKPPVIEVLPPGSAPISLDRKPGSSGLGLLYVGGVTPPIYDLSELLEVVSGEQNLHLTIVCREAESAGLKERCAGETGVRILHHSAAELAEDYRTADIASLFLGPSEYFAMAMPIKLFEAIGYGVPVLAREGTAAGDFVAREGVGWVASGLEEARAILRRLAGNPGELEAMRRKVREAAPRHSWAERARQVARDAEQVRSGRKSR